MPVSSFVRRLVTPVVDQIVYASTPYTDIKSALNQQSSRLVDFSRPPGGPSDERLRAAVRLISPREAAGHSLLRVGGTHDGGYVMADDFHVGGALSIGVGPDVSWDLDVARRGIPVALFDPTIRRLPSKVPGGVFHRIGIAGPSSVSARYQPLKALLGLAAFPPDSELLLKIDVEGAEWPSLSAVDEGDLGRYRQIVIEMHHLFRLAHEASAHEILGALQRLSSSHVPIHLHANNYSRLFRFDTDWFPDALEVSYVRRDLIAGPLHPSATVRSPLDVPSDERVEEIDLDGVLSLDSRGPV